MKAACARYRQALNEIGFDARRVTAGVNRREKGAPAMGNHLTLFVDLEGTRLRDLGLARRFVRRCPRRRPPRRAR
jgi:arylamine N-acetyltransferase